MEVKNAKKEGEEMEGASKTHLKKLTRVLKMGLYYEI
jgi:hypothetical protein